MKNGREYNQFVQSLENKAEGNLVFHNIENNVYITDHTRKLVGIWDLTNGSIQQECLPKLNQHPIGGGL